MLPYNSVNSSELSRLTLSVWWI